MKYLYLKIVEQVNPGLILLVVIHFFGALGLVSPLRDYFILFTPLTLIISAVILFSSPLIANRNFIIFSIFCFTIGFIVEFLGVHYGLIFGDYSYGPTLGYAIQGVPLIIGLNWLILIYSVGVITSWIKFPIWVKVTAGATMATLLDVIIEPVAIEYNFWAWQGDVIPLTNYLGWFIVSAVMLTCFHLLGIKSNSKIPAYFYKIQFLFFLTLYLFQLTI